jgi:hypothetical protein
MNPLLNTLVFANSVTEMMQLIFQTKTSAEENAQVQPSSREAPMAFQPASAHPGGGCGALGMTKFFQTDLSLYASGMLCEANFSEFSAEADAPNEGLKACLDRGKEHACQDAGMEEGEAEELQNYGGGGCDNICRTSCGKACEDDSADPKKCKERCAQDKEMCGCSSKKPVS